MNKKFKEITEKKSVKNVFVSVNVFVQELFNHLLSSL